MKGSAVAPDRTRYPLAVSEFQKAYELMPLRGPGDINDLVRGPPYVYAILTDAQISAV